ncbi:2,3-bisphosphoglycerate-independent phosphoglycerate mutase [bacterium]|nr:2,3-bisphosphoglycerate-independent phosphoglycerate mutase [bacterium]
MADGPVKALGGKTPLEAARTPGFDRMAREGLVGMARTVPKGVIPGSDVANLAILGLDPARYPLQRGAIEAASIGLPARPDTLYFRVNLITVKNDLIADYSAGHIDTKSAVKLLGLINRQVVLNGSLPAGQARLYGGVGYRHTLAWRAPAPFRSVLMSVHLDGPHDLIGRNVGEVLKPYENIPHVMVMQKSRRVMSAFPFNRGRKSPANMIWLWAQGEGKRLPTLRERFGLSGSVVSGVDLIRGLGKLVGLSVFALKRSTGYYDTDFAEKRMAALRELKQKDFVYLHIEAPDEAGHEKNPRMKKKMIETIDQKVLSPILNEVSAWPDRVRILAMPDHPTSCATGRHTSDPVPYVIWDSKSPRSGPAAFTERLAAKSGRILPAFHLLREKFVQMKEGL